VDVTIKSTGTLIDELITTNNKIFWALEKANEAGGDDVQVGIHYGKAQALNSRRSQLIAAIDERLGEDSSSVIKTF